MHAFVVTPAWPSPALGRSDAQTHSSAAETTSMTQYVLFMLCIYWCKGRISSDKTHIGYTGMQQQKNMQADLCQDCTGQVPSLFHCACPTRTTTQSTSSTVSTFKTRCRHAHNKHNGSIRPHPDHCEWWADWQGGKCQGRHELQQCDVM